MSGYTSLILLGNRSDEALALEEPLFAAEPGFAAEVGGPLTRAFLEVLPADWPTPIIDSHLVGLPRGYDPGPRVFHREVYPEYSGPGFDLANGEIEVEHIWCVFGHVMPEVIVGQVDTSGLPAMPTWKDAIAAERDRLVQAQGLPVASPGPGEVWRCDGQTWMRWSRAPQSGLHFWLRATRGTRRPWVNGRRNLGLKG